MPHILMVDDDRDLCDMVVRYLRDDGFRIEAVHTGSDGLHAIAAGQYDLVILDIMLPEMSGQELLRQLRSTATPHQLLPVVMLTARGEEVERVIGLETGADDYISKPCSLRELAARIRAVLRRVDSMQTRGRVPRLTLGKFDLDLDQRSASYDGRRLNLTGSEYSVLLCLMQASGKAVNKSTLTKAALGRDYDPSDRSIDMHIANLRKKLQQHHVAGEQIKTLRGGGYWLVANTEH